MRRALLVATLVCTAADVWAIAEADADPEAAARTAAESWLAVVDAGRYGESWDATAALFQEQVPRDTWVAQLSGVREPLGALSSRELKSSQHVTALPGAPPGQYVVMQFETDFENRKGVIETATAMAEGDDWKVAGYYVK